ncbi:MAG: hypothetical protein V1926_00115 [Candidatus Peregrinibacteria bacterium]
MSKFKRFEDKTVGNVIVLTFVDKKILDEDLIAEIGEDLRKVSEEGMEGMMVVLNFERITYLSSDLINRFIVLEAQIARKHGRLCLYCTRPENMEVFVCSKTKGLFIFRDTLEQAIAFVQTGV